ENIDFARACGSREKMRPGWRPWQSDRFREILQGHSQRRFLEALNGGSMHHQLPETDWIWHDGEFVRWADAKVHVMAHSVQYGSSVFEGIRCYHTENGPAVFRLTDHLRRLMGSCKIYRMEMRFSLDQLATAVCELIEKNKLDACYIRPMVIR